MLLSNLHIIIITIIIAIVIILIIIVISNTINAHQCNIDNKHNTDGSQLL